MVDALDKALIRSQTVVSHAHSIALRRKAAGGPLDVGGGMGGLSQFQEQSANRSRYSQFRGWVYSAVNIIASEAARQPVHVGTLAGSTNGTPKGVKGGLDTGRIIAGPHQIKMMTDSIRQKASRTELEIIEDHALVSVLDRPNSMQYRYQFVYSFIANLNLTGWGFIVGDTADDGTPVFYSLPTTWIVPNHEKGPFTRFKIVNPQNPGSEASGEWLDRTQVCFAYLPNPSDPMGALAPAAAQAWAVKIDDFIQTSQVQFFENGVFPSAIITMGKNPHPQVPGGIRPRLSPVQRRQVYSAIKKVSQGIANYGNPAIIDGMIESIERLSATQNEMGWEKSEKSVRARILSAWGVHPFILGEEMAGSYAQASIVTGRFCDRVNVFLDLLSTIMSEFAPRFTEKKKAVQKPKSNIMVWWEKKEAKDPQMEQAKWDKARDRDDVTQNEYRSEVLGLPPDEDKRESVINKSLAGPCKEIAMACTEGKMTPDQGKAILVGMGLPDDMAKDIAGEGPPEPPPEEAGGGFGDEDMGWGDEFGTEPADEESQFKRASRQLTKAFNLLETDDTALILDRSQVMVIE